MTGRSNAGASTFANAASPTGTEGDAVMTRKPDTHTDSTRNRHEGEGSILPLTIRQRLWDQLWTRLLAPPIDPADKAPTPRDQGTQDGGQR